MGFLYYHNFYRAWTHEKLSNTEIEVKELADKFLETHGFPQWVGTKDGMTTRQHKHYSYYNNKKSCFPSTLNVQAVYDCNYCFQDVVIKWPESVRDLRFSLILSVHKMLSNGTILPCEQVAVEDTFLLAVF